MPITAPTQRKLILPGERVYCPMMTIGGARAELPGHDEDDVLAAVDAGLVEWAWNIARPGARAREIRLLSKCVDHYKAGKRQTLSWSFERVVEEILGGHEKPFLQGTRVKLILNCGSTHVMNLVSDGELKTLKGTTWNTGPNGSPVITRESFVSFLDRRRVL